VDRHLKRHFSFTESHLQMKTPITNLMSTTCTYTPNPQPQIAISYVNYTGLHVSLAQAIPYTRLPSTTSGLAEASRTATT
jgi:hypothetical protein